MTRVYLYLGFASFALVVGVICFSWSYYTLPLEERPLHPHHEVLRSSGSIGLFLGVLGVALMLSSLIYLLRRRIPFLQRLGSGRSWLGFHVLTGLVGPAVILLHTSFAPSSALGILALAAMLVMVAAGTIGRYIYARFPHSISGRELGIEEIRGRLGEHRAELAIYGIETGLFERKVPTGIEERRNPLSIFTSVILGDRQVRRQYASMRRTVEESPVLRPQAAMILPLFKMICRERQWLARYYELRSLMGSWRFLHRWLAILMFLMFAFHVLVAVRFGNLWILS
ncbi:MAG: hypothetical protein ACE5GW_08360 [Planctomycetota bacterium]